MIVDTFGTGTIAAAQIERADRRDLRPAPRRRSARSCDLRRPIYRQTAAYGHFGREDHDFTWERTDKAEALRNAAGLAEARSVA